MNYSDFVGSNVYMCHLNSKYFYPVRVCAAGLCVWSRPFVYIRVMRLVYKGYAFGI